MRRAYIDLNGLIDGFTLNSIIHQLHPTYVLCWNGLPAYRDSFIALLEKDKSYKVIGVERDPVEVVSDQIVMKMRLNKLQFTQEKKVIGRTEIEYVHFLPVISFPTRDFFITIYEILLHLHIGVLQLAWRSMKNHYLAETRLLSA